MLQSFSMKYTAKNLEETQKIAQEFVQKLKPLEKSARVIGLYGELGAGKTSFTQGVAKAFDINDNVVSPTFVIEKIYHLADKQFDNLIHIDAYRLDHSGELLQLGWQEIISDPKNLILIEWPERVEDIMPSHIKVIFKHIEGDGREIEILE